MTKRQWTRGLLAAVLLLIQNLSQVLAQSQTQSASELLQKGIYLQETVGDLDGAIKAFQQVVRMANESRAMGAQAEYRLGLCLQKQGKLSEANKSFQNVITNYPEQSELVSRARALVDPALQFKLLPVPWKDGEVLEMVRKSSNGRPWEAIHYSVVSSKSNPAHWLLEEDYAVGTLDRRKIITELDGKAMQPIFSNTVDYTFGKSQTIYHDSEVHVEDQNQQKKEAIDFHLDGPVWDNNEIWALLRRLPLVYGYKVTIPISTEGEVRKRDFIVSGKEDVRTPAGTFHCYRVESRQVLESMETFFISTDSSRYLVKIEQSPVLTSELEKISYVTTGPVAYIDDKLGFSLTVPDGWRIYNYDIDWLGRATLVDPEFRAVIILAVRPLKQRYILMEKPGYPVTAEGMQEHIKSEIDNSKRFDQVVEYNKKVRPDSWQVRQIGGRPAVSWVTDYTDSFGTKRTLYSVEIQGDQDSAVFLSEMEAGSDLAAFQKRFDPIIASLSIK